MAQKVNKTKTVVVASVPGAEGKKPVAVQVCNEAGDIHGVALRHIRVIIVPDGPSWFAQGVDIDYASQGESVDAAKANFENGLRATIDQHLNIYGTIRGILEPAALEILGNLVTESSAQFERYSQVSAHEIHESLPYAQINYLVDQAPRELVQ
jgi:hypothetical protein